MRYGSKTALAAVLLALVAAACGASEPGGTGGDGGQTTLTVYSGREKDLVQPLFEKFEAANPSIKLAVRYGDSAELAAQMLEEGGNSPADVFFAQDAGALGAVANGLANLDQEILSSVPEAFRSDAGKWVGISGRARVVVHNTDSVKPADLPASIEGFTDPKWKGKIGWAPTNGSFQAFVTGLRVLKGDEAARTWLRGIKANDPVVYPKNTPIVEAAAAGEIQVGFVNHYYLLRLKKEQPAMKAANHFFKGGDPGALVNVAGAGILSTSKSKAAASTFVKYLLSAEAQQFFATETFEYPLATGVEASADLPKLSALEPPDLDLSKLSDLEATLTMLRDEGIL
ncbi:MAG TPA: iron ABC transporter substrate-binding protein [Actinomycetota bacterium]|nr:iron ABC transporter substrate-binding protein [Actinomycetota bacterium]